MNFKLDKQQVKKYKEWRKNKKATYVGAIGGAESFTFIPTGIGVICTVQLRTDKRIEKLDLTDYDNW